MLLEILIGTLISLALLVTAGALLQLPKRRPRHNAPPDRTSSGLATSTRKRTPRNAPIPPSKSTRDAPTVDRDDPPAGIRMTPLDTWDVITVGLIGAMFIVTGPAAPAADTIIATLIVPGIVLGVILAIRIFCNETDSLREKKEK